MDGKEEENPDRTLWGKGGKKKEDVSFHWSEKSKRRF